VNLGLGSVAWALPLGYIRLQLSSPALDRCVGSALTTAG